MNRFLRGMGWTVAIILLLWLILAQSCMTFRRSDSDARKEFAAAGISIRISRMVVDGHTIHYAMTGRDTLPTLFFIHGSPGSWDAFRRYMKDPDLLRRFRMVSIDRPGFGHSDYGRPQHLDKQSELISPLFPLLDNHRKRYLVGHSLGGPMIIKLAADNPGMFSGMVILAGSIDPGEEQPEKWRPWLFRTPLNYFVPGAMRPSNEELWYLKKDLVSMEGDFAHITCPVFMLHGTADPLVPYGNTDYGKKMLVNAPSVEIIPLTGANHFIPWNRFEVVKGVILRL